MSDIKKVLTEEIRRLAKKEIKAAVEPLAAKLAELKKLVTLQGKELKALKSSEPKVKNESKSALPETESKDIRLNAKGIRRIREKLGVSQGVFAKLIGANMLSVSHWELGKSEPRAEFKKRIASLRKMGKRDLLKHCQEMKIDLKPARGRKKKDVSASDETKA